MRSIHMMSFRDLLSVIESRRRLSGDDGLDLPAIVVVRDHHGIVHAGPVEGVLPDRVPVAAGATEVVPEPVVILLSDGSPALFDVGDAGNGSSSVDWDDDTIVEDMPIVVDGVIHSSRIASSASPDDATFDPDRTAIFHGLPMEVRRLPA